MYTNVELLLLLLNVTSVVVSMFNTVLLMLSVFSVWILFFIVKFRYVLERGFGWMGYLWCLNNLYGNVKCFYGILVLRETEREIEMEHCSHMVKRMFVSNFINICCRFFSLQHIFYSAIPFIPLQHLCCDACKNYELHLPYNCIKREFGISFLYSIFCIILFGFLFLYSHFQWKKKIPFNIIQCTRFESKNRFRSKWKLLNTYSIE